MKLTEIARFTDDVALVADFYARLLNVAPQIATCVYTYHWRGSIDGVTREGFGRGTNVLRRAGNQWHIIHEHLSPWPSQRD